MAGRTVSSGRTERKFHIGIIIVGAVSDGKEKTNQFWALGLAGINLKQENDEDQLAAEQLENSVQ